MTKVIIFGNSFLNTLGLIRSVGLKGYPVILLLEPVKKCQCYVRHSKYITKIHYLKSVEEGLQVLFNEYGNENEKPVVLCGSDSIICMLDAHYNMLKEKFHIFNAGEQGRINYFLDKINTFSIAKDCGFTLIKSWLVTDIKNLPIGITYPCLIKGNNSTESTKGDMFICHNEAELKDCLHEGVEYLIQEYIQKEYELDIVGLAYNQGKKVFAPAVVRKIRETLYRQSDYIRLDDIKEYSNFNPNIISNFLRKLSYEGIFSIEVIYSKGKYYFLEINMRNDGTSWLYTVAGINYPYLWTLYCVGKLTDEILSTIRFTNHLYLMSENDVYNMFGGSISFVQWIKDFYKSGAFFIMNAKDPKPFFFSTLNHIRQFGKLILRKTLHINIE